MTDMLDKKRPRRIWDDYIPERDKRIINQAGYGGRSEWGTKPAIIIVDATYNFLGQPSASIEESIRQTPNACGPEAWVAVNKIRQLLETARHTQIPIFYTIAGFREDGWDLGSWRWKQPRSQEELDTKKNKEGNLVVSEISPKEQDIVISKLKPSAFFETPLRSLLQLMNIDTLVVAGGTTSGCVRGTVLDGFSHNFKVIVPEDACFDRVEVSHAISLFDINSKYGDVVNTEEANDYLRGLKDQNSPSPDLIPN